MARPVPALTSLLMTIASAKSWMRPLLDWIAVVPVLSTVSVCPGPALSEMLPPSALLVISGALGKLPGAVSIVKLPPAVRDMLPEGLLLIKALAFRGILPPADAVIPVAALTDPGPTPSPRLRSRTTIRLTLPVLLKIAAASPG